MRTVALTNAICWLIVTYALLGCNKEKLNAAVANTGPCNCYGIILTSFNVSLKRVNNYPAGAKIFIERFGYPNADSSTINRFVLFDKSLPINDTTFSQIEMKNYTQYLKWKISSATNDSLSGGMTAKLTTTDNPITFEINY